MSRLLFILCFLATTQITFAQPNHQSFDAYFQEVYQDWDIPGFSIGIIKDGKVVLSKGYGVLEKGKSFVGTLTCAINFTHATNYPHPPYPQETSQ